MAAWLGEAVDRPAPGSTLALRFVQCDDLSGYGRIFGAETPLSRAACWAHARRKWHDLRGSFPAAWQEAQGLIAALYAIEKPFNTSRPAEDAPAQAWAD